MKVLYILRHGKSSPAPPDGADHDRPLDRRGARAAAAMAAEFARRGWRPARALVSPARRARATFEFFARALAASGGGRIEDRVEDSLYLAPPDRVLDCLAALDAALPSVLVVGHNPGLHELACGLAGARRGAAADRLARGFPTCALAVFRCAADDWAQIGPGKARLEDVIFARDLDQS